MTAPLPCSTNQEGRDRLAAMPCRGLMLARDWCLPHRTLVCGECARVIHPGGGFGRGDTVAGMVDGLHLCQRCWERREGTRVRA